MAETDFLTISGAPVRSKNAPAAGIDFRDLDYICENRTAFKCLSLEEAAAEFSRLQPEPQKMAAFDAERTGMTAELQSLREAGEEVSGQIEEKERQKQQEKAMLEEIAVFKNALLCLLPERYLEDGRRFLNNFIMRRDEGNYMPGESPEDKKIKAAAAKLLSLKALNRFKDEFTRLQADFKAFTPRFDVTADKAEVLADIERHYATDEQKHTYDELQAKVARIDQKQQELLSAAGAERISLDHKLERFRSYYDKRLYPRADYEKVPNSPEKEKFFENLELGSAVWKMLMNAARAKNIGFAETFGVVENDIPTAVFYDKDRNRFLCNQSFCVDEQLFEIAKILVSDLMPPLQKNCDAKSRYLYELCRQSEQSALLTELGGDFAGVMPVLKSCLIVDHAGEMSAYMGGVDKTDKYRRAFAKAFSSSKVRQAAERETIAQLAAFHAEKTEQGEQVRLRNLTIGEVIGPFVSRGAPLLNESPEIRQQLGIIPLDSKMKIQEQANLDKDYSLVDMAGS